MLFQSLTALPSETAWFGRLDAVAGSADTPARATSRQTTIGRPSPALSPGLITISCRE
jgi:hypothetical protein